MTRITTSPTRVYRERASPVRLVTSTARLYRRDVNSPARIITSPARIVNIRVRPSVLSREFDRIERKYRSSPVGINDTEEYLNSSYALVCRGNFHNDNHYSVRFFRTSVTQLVTSVPRLRD